MTIETELKFIASKEAVTRLAERLNSCPGQHFEPARWQTSILKRLTTSCVAGIWGYASVALITTMR
ncbi:Uncharacterised protein [Tatumella ptyseos]|uniref:Uncharacterized protein n=1 Tax=Tatumella ptyseos TaxID=82987 RepID=A0A2X5NGF9_9GAMM|nr:Uncharacterised protein [Tatumella ptyseos]